MVILLEICECLLEMISLLIKLVVKMKYGFAENIVQAVLLLQVRGIRISQPQ